MAFNPPLGSNSPVVLLDNATRLDKLVNGPAADVLDRAGDPLYSWRQMMAKNDEIRQNLIPLSRQYMTLEAAQADIANIPEGSTTYYRSPDDSALAIEVINHGGTLEPTGRKMPSQNHIDQMIGLSDSGNIAMQTDSTGQVIAVTDDFGGVSIPDVPGTLQEALAPVKTNRAPAILRLSDADNAAYGSVDDFGGLNLPGIPASVQHMLNNHQDKIQNLIRNGRVLDVRDCGFNAKTGENAVYAIQRAINWLSGQGGGVVYLPQANYLLSGYITPRSNVSIIGAGVDKSVLLPYKSFAAFRRIGNVNDYLQNVIMSDFTIDGANQVLNPTSGYLPEIKGTVILYWKDCVMDKLKMVNTGATALGNDMPYNCSIMRCYIENAGRLVPNRDAGIWERPLGASGIGLGTGALDDEPIYVAFNTVRKCANFGLFFEPQGGGAARGAVAIGNILEENYAGLADCGVDGLQAVSNQMRFNKFGILRYPGTNNDGKPGRRGQFIGNIVDSNTDHGIYSYSTKTDPLIGWNIYSNNQVTNNGKDGFNFRYTNPVVGMQNETVSGNHIYANGRHGINVEESLSVTNCDFLSNKIWGNGQKEAGNGVNSAVPFTACSINGNQIRDTQSTPTQQYPVNLTGVLTDVDISMNHCVGNVNNSINTSNSANQRVSKNINAGI
ncbi:right-handed parallel beta-helix repeat-containing protein [Klebsiella aerogenes]|uniref:right-handed parallel beta-helix repeat-containing protein n=1 Tax=Klebsiella aerogenes TaxID=548 RepID=UPI002DBB79F7|nr:glycosyl hydrolase family 28-related protein [Klebsiella aerogenes]MEB6107599.1 right-handed parallel beta-helix repeat-containing protein [Klebsiella aerogenes]